LGNPVLLDEIVHRSIRLDEITMVGGIVHELEIRTEASELVVAVQGTVDGGPADLVEVVDQV